MRELELKFSVHEPFTVPDLLGAKSPVSAVSKPTRVALRAAYYDTDDLRLARWGITLRRRTGGDDAGWHLKLPLIGDHDSARDEIAAAPVGRGIPEELLDLVTAYTRGAALKPVATLRTERRSQLLYDGEGQPAAELVDDTVSILDGTSVLERFREIEVESKGADLGFLKQVAAQLEDAGAVGGAFLPKAIRALGSRASAAPDVEAPALVSKRSTAADVVTAFLRTHVGALLRQDPLVRQGAEDSVHQMRVAARQLRSGLKTFRPLVDADWASGIRTELAWLAGSLGAARDAEVMQARFAGQLELIEDVALRALAGDAVTRSMAAAQKRGDEQLREALRSQQYLGLLDALVSGAAEAPFTDAASNRADDVLPTLARRAWQRLAKRIDIIDDAAPNEELHEARIYAKQARYAAEACALAFGAPAKALAKEIVRVQDVLGEHQDSVIAAEQVSKLARSRAAKQSGELGFALGVLYCIELQAADRSRGQLPAVWQEVSRRRHRAWLE